MELVIVTGISGAGKSMGVDALEDIGFFCAENMPPKLIPTFIQLILDSKEKREKVAVVSDIRVGGSFKDLFNALDELKKMNCNYKILFFDANSEVLIRRYKETRRKHPLTDKFNGSIADAIEAERVILEPARGLADYVIDTSNTLASDCKQKVAALFMDNPSQAMRIHCISFGYKFGIPSDSDLLFDVRFLPNPFYETELKAHMGLEKPVIDYVMKWEQTKGFLPKLYDLLDYLIPLYRAEGKSQLTIAVGCTGGRHRSVVIAECVRKHLSGKDNIMSINHRDIKK